MSQELEVINQEEDDVKLEDLSIAALRKYAALYRLTVAKTSTKEDIINIIKQKRNSQDMALIVDEETAGSGPKPGWSRIQLHRDPTPGAENHPLYVGCNGYNIAIPRGVDVDVPNKVVGVLNDATEQRLVENYSAPSGSAERWSYQKQLSYPFSLIAMNPGPDPRPGYEKGKAAAHRPREKFRELFGRWPTHGELLEAQKEGLIKVSDFLTK